MHTYQKTLLAGALLFLGACSGNSEEEKDISFDDENLEHAVAEEAEKDAGELTVSDVESIGTLDAANAGITSINGIEQLVNLSTLSLEGNEIDDFSPLQELENLETVHAGTIYLTEDVDEVPWSVLETLENDGVDVDARASLSFDEHDGPSRGVFYEVNEGGQTVYLFGSVHVGNDSIYPLEESIEEAFASADHLAVEIDIASVDEMEASNTMMEKGMYTDGTSLQDVVDDEIFEEAVELLSGFGIPEAMINGFQPWFVSLMLSDIALMQTDFNNEDGIDLYFLERAHDKGLPVISLESLESQMDAISSAPEEDQAASLENMVNEFDEYGEQLSQLMNVWQAGHTDVFAFLRQSDTDADQLAMDERDEEMTTQIVDFLEEDSGETYFVVVGAMHLAGENSIPDLLEKEGYEVEVPEGY